MHDDNGLYYDLYEYGNQIDYENTPDSYGFPNGPALIHNVESIKEKGEEFKENSRIILKIANPGIKDS